jgi:hypothetical protein
VTRRDVSVSSWRRIAGLLGLIFVSASIACGGFAWLYWNQFAGHTTGPPEPTYVATLVGFALALVGVPASLCAKAKTRIALILCLAGLGGFYFLMFLSP